MIKILDEVQTHEFNEEITVITKSYKLTSGRPWYVLLKKQDFALATGISFEDNSLTKEGLEAFLACVDEAKRLGWFTSWTTDRSQPATVHYQGGKQQ